MLVNDVDGGAVPFVAAVAILKNRSAPPKIDFGCY
jgi:hypothetical protein